MTRPRRSAARGQAGLTLVELMITMSLVALLVGMVFTLFSQTASGLRYQVEIGGLQQALVGAQTVLGRDLRQAGLQVPDGYKVAYDNGYHLAIDVINDSDGPDQIAVAYADPSVQALVTSMNLAADTVTVDDAAGIVEGALVVLADPQTVAVDDPQIYDACVVRIESVDGDQLTLSTAAPWGQPGNAQCNPVQAAQGGGSTDTMLYGFVTRAYRIDPTRPELGVLQRSSSGGLDDTDWEDLGVGFTDLQVATRWYQPGDLVDLDGDGDAERDWYSGDDQDVLTAPSATMHAVVPVELTISLVVRTVRDLGNAVVSARTPDLSGDDDPEHNRIGDHPAVELDGVPDVDRPDALRGNRVYRWSTTRYDLRNVGVSR